MIEYFVKKSFNDDPERTATPPADKAWVYGSEVTAGELDDIAGRYGLDRDILQDVLDTHELPRLDYTHDVLYMFIRMPLRSRRGRMMTVPFLMIIKGTVLLTLSAKSYTTTDELLSRSDVNMRSAKHLFLKLIDHTINQFAEYVHTTGKYVRNTELRLKSHEVSNNDFLKFVTVEGDLNTYKTNLSAIQVILNRLQENKHGVFTEKECETVEDICLLVNQLLVSSGSHMKVIESIRNAYTTISNNTLNKRMKTLTLLTLLVALPNVFYGMYGMNVALPFAEQPWAYAMVTGFTFLLVLVVYLIVRKIRF